MRLKSVYIDLYKNLHEFNLELDGSSFVDIFVGKNGSGKSNLFEALMEIFRHLDQFSPSNNDIAFNYRLKYEIDGTETDIEWKDGKLRINKDENRSGLGQTPFPENVLIYYSGHNITVPELVAQYEQTFADRIKKAGPGESRRFIGVGPQYKALLLAVLLAQQNGSAARSFICRKLGIDKLGLVKPGSDELTESLLRIELKRPDYAQGSEKKKYDIEFNDGTDKYWKAEGITKDFLNLLDSCTWTNKDGLTVTEGYLSRDDRYILYISISKLQEGLDNNSQELFRQLDNLQTLGMLADISVPLQLISGAKGALRIH